MALLKCKMCGGDLRIAQEDRIAVCEYCGSRQTLPRLESDRLVALFDRANQYRTDNEFDKASAIYESILMEVPEEAEAHWGICLCRYGIEYVKDPATQKRIPTCHRAQFKSILEDRDYLAALQYAEEPAGTLYEEEAVYIDTIQKGILETSAKEDPYDIFICYKESDETDNRTLDSLIAQEIYSELTAKGYRVFFSRITLEDKLGIEYEPYIFAALTSARIMLAVGTKPEHYEAAWVKNEWSRYLSLIEAGHRKTMIACYRNMQPYEMPREFEILQALDVSRIGWKEDLVRGIAKILPAPKKEQDPRQAEAPAALKPSQDPASVERTLQSAVQMAHTLEQLKNQHPKVQDAQTKTTIGHYIGDLVAEMMGILDRCPANEWRVSWLRYCLYKQYGDYLSESYDSLKLDGYYKVALRAAPEGFKPLLQKERSCLAPKLEIWKEQPVRVSVAEPKAQPQREPQRLVRPMQAAAPQAAAVQKTAVLKKPLGKVPYVLLVCGIELAFVAAMLLLDYRALVTSGGIGIFLANGLLILNALVIGLVNLWGRQSLGTYAVGLVNLVFAILFLYTIMGRLSSFLGTFGLVFLGGIQLVIYAFSMVIAQRIKSN